MRSCDLISIWAIVTVHPPRAVSTARVSWAEGPLGTRASGRYRPELPRSIGADDGGWGGRGTVHTTLADVGSELARHRRLPRSAGPAVPCDRGKRREARRAASGVFEAIDDRGPAVLGADLASEPQTSREYLELVATQHFDTTSLVSLPLTAPCQRDGTEHK
jgi:hypothetical protein